MAVVIVGCGKAESPATGSASGSAVANGSAVASGSAPVPAGSGSGSAKADVGSGFAVAAGSAAAAKGSLELKPGERLHEPLIEMPWIPVAGRMKVTLLALDGTPDTARLVVWGAGLRHDVLTIKKPCLASQHGTELFTGTKNTVVFRCESQGKDRVLADEWLIHWPDTKDFPTVYRHWRGGQKQRDRKWAGARLFYGPQKKEPPTKECCCAWQDEDLMGTFDIVSRDYCKGSSDMHGICVAESKCARPDDDP